MPGIWPSAGKGEGPVLHFLHILVFSALLSVFFATMFGRQEKRWKLGGVLFLCMAGGGLLAGFLMAPFS